MEVNSEIDNSRIAEDIEIVLSDPLPPSKHKHDVKSLINSFETDSSQSNNQSKQNTSVESDECWHGGSYSSRSSNSLGKPTQSASASTKVRKNLVVVNCDEQDQVEVIQPFSMKSFRKQKGGATSRREKMQPINEKENIQPLSATNQGLSKDDNLDEIIQIGNSNSNHNNSFSSSSYTSSIGLNTNTKSNNNISLNSSLCSSSSKVSSSRSGRASKTTSKSEARSKSNHHQSNMDPVSDNISVDSNLTPKVSMSNEDEVKIKVIELSYHSERGDEEATRQLKELLEQKDLEDKFRQLSIPYEGGMKNDSAVVAVEQNKSQENNLSVDSNLTPKISMNNEHEVKIQVIDLSYRSERGDEEASRQLKELLEQKDLEDKFRQLSVPYKKGGMKNDTAVIAEKNKARETNLSIDSKHTPKISMNNEHEVKIQVIDLSYRSQRGDEEATRQLMELLEQNDLEDKFRQLSVPYKEKGGTKNDAVVVAEKNKTKKIKIDDDINGCLEEVAGVEVDEILSPAANKQIKSEEHCSEEVATKASRDISLFDTDKSFSATVSKGTEEAIFMPDAVPSPDKNVSFSALRPRSTTSMMSSSLANEKDPIFLKVIPASPDKKMFFSTSQRISTPSTIMSMKTDMDDSLLGVLSTPGSSEDSRDFSALQPRSSSSRSTTKTKSTKDMSPSSFKGQETPQREKNNTDWDFSTMHPSSSSSMSTNKTKSPKDVSSKSLKGQETQQPEHPWAKSKLEQWVDKDPSLCVNISNESSVSLDTPNKNKHTNTSKTREIPQRSQECNFDNKDRAQDVYVGVPFTPEERRERYGSPSSKKDKVTLLELDVTGETTPSSVGDNNDLTSTWVNFEQENDFNGVNQKDKLNMSDTYLVTSKKADLQSEDKNGPNTSTTSDSNYAFYKLEAVYPLTQLPVGDKSERSMKEEIDVSFEGKVECLNTSASRDSPNIIRKNVESIHLSMMEDSDSNHMETTTVTKPNSTSRIYDIMKDENKEFTNRHCTSEKKQKKWFKVPKSKWMKPSSTNKIDETMKAEMNEGSDGNIGENGIDSPLLHKKHTKIASQDIIEKEEVCIEQHCTPEKKQRSWFKSKSKSKSVNEQGNVAVNEEDGTNKQAKKKSPERENLIPDSKNNVSTPEKKASWIYKPLRASPASVKSPHSVATGKTEQALTDDESEAKPTCTSASTTESVNVGDNFFSREWIQGELPNDSLEILKLDLSAENISAIEEIASDESEEKIRADEDIPIETRWVMEEILVKQTLFQKIHDSIRAKNISLSTNKKSPVYMAMNPEEDITATEKEEESTYNFLSTCKDAEKEDLTAAEEHVFEWEVFPPWDEADTTMKQSNKRDDRKHKVKQKGVAGNAKPEIWVVNEGFYFMQRQEQKLLMNIHDSVYEFTPI